MSLPLLLLLFGFTSWDSVALPAFVSLPPAADLERFPSYDMCDNQLTFFSARRAWLDAQRGLFPDPMYAPWFDAAFEDLEDRRRPWMVLYEAQGWVAPVDGMDERDERRNYPPESRNKMARRKLAELRTLVGDEDYNNGLLPALIDPRFTSSAD